MAWTVSAGLPWELQPGWCLLGLEFACLRQQTGGEPAERERDSLTTSLRVWVVRVRVVERHILPLMSEEVQAPPPAIPYWKNFVSGTVGGTCLVVAGHPLDTIKVRMQTVAMSTPAGQPLPFNGALDCARQTLAKEGFRGLYKGMASPIAGVSFLYAICFSSYGWAKKVLETTPGAPLSINRIGWAGAFAGVATTVVTTPIELVKARLQIQYSSGHAQFSGPVDAVVKILKQNGIRGVYRGTGATLLRDVPGSYAYFAGYEFVRRKFIPEGGDAGDLSPLVLLFAGGMGGVFNWLAIFPIDVIKSRLQTAPEGRYLGMVDCFKKIVSQEGYAALFKGLTPTLIRSFPANAACFLGFEMTLRLIS